jgi:uncharacterized protein YneF (UPF0154 family)
MTLIIQILIALILLAVLIIAIIGIIYILSIKQVKEAIKKAKPIKREALIIDGEPKTEEEEAIEREERILKIIGSEK